jgi:mRNA interferase MazF
MVTYKTFDIVVVPFPFVDSNKSKRRPAIILSSDKNFNSSVSHSVMAMITSARNVPWPLDVPIKDLSASGLPKPSVIRMKFFTLDHRLILEKIGSLATKDQTKLKKHFGETFAQILKK